MDNIVRLVCHPDTPPQIECAITVALAGSEIVYVVEGDVAGLVLPRQPAARTDELWRTTCCEAFVKPDGGESYRELNFAASGAWAAYDFDAYRQGMRDADVAPPAIRCEQDSDRLTLRVALAEMPTPCRLGLSAVIEEARGARSYWALAHPPGRPDFHHPACFAVQLP